MEKNKRSSNAFYTKLCILLGIVLIVFTIYNLTQTFSFKSTYNQELDKLKEETRPAVIELITIGDNNCFDCFDIGPIVKGIEKANINITKGKTLDINSIEAKELISKYNIEKVPTVIVFGEIDRLNIKNLEKREDILLFTGLTPPYTDTKTLNILGRVSATLVEDQSCDKCINIKQLVELLKQAGVNIISERSIKRNTNEGEELIDKYSIKVLPALILSKDFGYYKLEIIQNWNSIGSIEEDESYVTRIIGLPYLNLTSDEVEGLVSITSLVDDSCEECYDPDEFHKPLFQSIGVVFGKEERIDISSSEGKYLIDKYDIEKVPTVILGGDVEMYNILVEAWKDFGSIESDGAYIFRKVEIMGQTYKDLNTGQIVKIPTIN